MKLYDQSKEEISVAKIFNAAADFLEAEIQSEDRKNHNITQAFNYFFNVIITSITKSIICFNFLIFFKILFYFLTFIGF